MQQESMDRMLKICGNIIFNKVWFLTILFENLDPNTPESQNGQKSPQPISSLKRPPVTF